MVNGVCDDWFVDENASSAQVATGGSAEGHALLEALGQVCARALFVQIMCAICRDTCVLFAETCALVAEVMPRSCALFAETHMLHSSPRRDELVAEIV